MREGVLYHMADYTPEHTNYIFQLVVPKSQQEEVLSGIHEGVGGGHLGVEKSVAKLKERFAGQDIIMMLRSGVLIAVVAWPEKHPHHTIEHPCNQLG